MPKKVNLPILGLFLFIILSWSLSWPINKIALAHMSPLWFTAIRLMIGTATMMTIVIATDRFSLPKLKDIPLILVIGLLQISLYILLTNLGLAYMPAGRASILAYTTPLWVMPITLLLFKERPGPMKWMGFLLGIAGLILLLNPWELNWMDKRLLLGTSLLLLASLSWAISMLCVRYMPWSKSPLELIPWQLLIGTLPILCFAYLKEPTLQATWEPALILSLLYTGTLVTGISYWSGVVINKALPTIAVSLGFLAVPILSLLVSSLFLHETISAITISAVTLILTGLICVIV